MIKIHEVVLFLVFLLGLMVGVVSVGMAKKCNSTAAQLQEASARSYARAREAYTIEQEK